MLPNILSQALRRSAYLPLRTITSPSKRSLSQTAVRLAKDKTMPSGPPKHEMQYFPNIVNALPSESAEFRRVLWTGLYSQVVLMTVPVGGDIGDEVGLSLCRI